MTTNTPNRALIACSRCGNPDSQMCDCSLPGAFVTPPADEVGRAVERLTSRAASIERMTYAESAAWAAEKREHAADLRLILSHVSDLEIDRDHAELCASETAKANDLLEASLKLAVEALEPFAKVAGLYDESEDDGHEVWFDRSTTSLGVPAETFLLRNYRGARETLRSISSLRHDLESASQSASPPLRQDTLPEGFVLVPRVPTIEMVVAATEQWLCIAAQEDRAEVIWDAMLDAAPVASGGGA